MNKVKVIKRVKKANPIYSDCQHICNASKNLYNVMTYIRRQSIFNEGVYLDDTEIYDLAKQHPDWKVLPGRVSNQVWKQHCKAWKAYFAAKKKYQKHPELFTGKPKFPNYNKNDHSIVIYEKQALNTRGLAQGTFKLSGTDLVIETGLENVKEIRIEPKADFFEIKVIYEVGVKHEINLDQEAIASIDIGLSNLAAVTSNQAGLPHFMINGNPLKALNQHFNKVKAYLQSLLPKGVYLSNRILALLIKRNDKVKDYLHKASRYIIDWLVENRIGTLVIGRNKGWKQEINIGKRNNQSFVQIPFYKFISMLTYKAGECGIRVIEQQESYTSKTSALDLEKPCKHKVYMGKRTKRGLFRTKSGVLISSDINGSLQILRKAFTNSLDKVIEDKQFIHYCSQPKVVTI